MLLATTPPMAATTAAHRMSVSTTPPFGSKTAPLSAPPIEMHKDNWVAKELARMRSDSRVTEDHMQMEWTGPVAGGGPVRLSDAVDRLPPEPQTGNTEYKWKLMAPSDARLERLTTQMRWRLSEGGGVAIYEVASRVFFVHPTTSSQLPIHCAPHTVPQPCGCFCGSPVPLAMLPHLPSTARCPKRTCCCGACAYIALTSALHSPPPIFPNAMMSSKPPARADAATA